MQYNAFAILVCNSIKKEGKTLPLRESNVRIRGSFHIYGGCFFLFFLHFSFKKLWLKVHTRHESESYETETMAHFTFKPNPYYNFIE